MADEKDNLYDFEKFWLELSDENPIFDNLMEVFAVSDHLSNKSFSQTEARIKNVHLNWAFLSEHLEVNPNIHKTILKILETYYKNLDSDQGAENWMRLIYEIHLYAKPYSELASELFIKSEIKLFGNKTDLKLKEPYKATNATQHYFHTYRAYFRGQEKDFDSAESILNALDEANIESDIRTDILLSRFIHFICTGQWEKSIHDIQKMWATIKLMGGKHRYDTGAWDNWFLANLVLWGLGRYSEKLKSLLTSLLFNNPECLFSYKKQILFQAISHQDLALIVNPVYYERARIEIPELPDLSA